MKKIITILSAAMFSLFTAQAHAEWAFGVTANMATVDTDGTETLRDSGKKTKSSVSKDVTIPELFIEAVSDAGAIGLAFIPTQEIGKKKRTDSAAVSENDAGDYKAEAEVGKHAMIYANINLLDVMGGKLYAMAGLSYAEIITLENLNGGSTYENQDVLGTTYGAGFRGNLTDTYFYKVEGTFTDYDGFSDTNTAGNKIVADSEVTSIKLSVGAQF